MDWRSPPKKMAVVTGGPGTSTGGSPGMTVRSMLSPSQLPRGITSPRGLSLRRALVSSLIGRGTAYGRIVDRSIKATSSEYSCMPVSASATVVVLLPLPDRPISSALCVGVDTSPAWTCTKPVQRCSATETTIHSAHRAAAETPNSAGCTRSPVITDHAFRFPESRAISTRKSTRAASGAVGYARNTSSTVRCRMRGPCTSIVSPCNAIRRRMPSMLEDSVNADA